MDSTRGPLPCLYTAESSMSGGRSGFFDSSRTLISSGLHPACSMSQPTAGAKVACRLCNARRVRCDRSESGAPCSNCRLTNTDCELIVSQRGKHGSCRFTTGCSRELMNFAIQASEISEWTTADRCVCLSCRSHSTQQQPADNNAVRASAQSSVSPTD